MKVIEQSAHIVDTTKGGILQQIERLGRVCYKSEDKITPDSAAIFVKNAIFRGHNTVLEMAFLHLVIEFTTNGERDEFLAHAPLRHFNISHHCIPDVPYYYGDKVYLLMSGNVRAFREMRHLNSDTAWSIKRFLIYEYEELFADTLMGAPPLSVFDPSPVRFADPEEIADKPKHNYVCVRFITSRDVTHQLVRYRRTSPLQESQRYCNLTSNRFNNSVNFIRPCWYTEGTEEYRVWEAACRAAEVAYFDLTHRGSSEKARTVLPNSTKSELLIYADLEEWQHIFNQRVSPHAYAPTRELLTPLYEEFKVRYKGLIV